VRRRSKLSTPLTKTWVRNTFNKRLKLNVYRIPITGNLRHQLNKQYFMSNKRIWTTSKQSIFLQIKFCSTLIVTTDSNATNRMTQWPSHRRGHNWQTISHCYAEFNVHARAYRGRKKTKTLSDDKHSPSLDGLSLLKTHPTHVLQSIQQQPHVFSKYILAQHIKSKLTIPV
jgi:hypothetical protein